MKKILALVLALTMVAAMAACTPANNNDTTTEATGTTTEATTDNKPTVTFATALELLNAVWAQFPEEGKFPVMGGDEANANFEGPGKVELPGAEGNALWSLNIPEDQLVNFTEAATMIHAMNTNTFACGAMKLADGADKTAVAAAVKDGILGTHWMCGFPERMVVISAGDYLVVAFGLEMNVTNLTTALTAVVADAQILHSEVIR